MAHGDYNCCAICDAKMAYNSGDARTKEDVCVDCIERAIAAGQPITRAAQIKDVLAPLDDAGALAWLHSMGYCPCYYQNEIDDYLIARGLVLTGSTEPGAKWGKLLAPLPAAA